MQNSTGIRKQSRGLLVAIALACSVPAFAQHPNENAVAEASDAFGTAVGREVIGLYTASSARGFSPSQAGNLRISGLYFDQIGMATPVNRIVRGSTVHVGISAQGYAFPAPTGVVDFQLRTPGRDPSVSVLLGDASYQQQYAEVDFQTPLVGDSFALGGGVGFSGNNSYKIADHSQELNAGLIARWQPTDALTITPFWGAMEHREYQERPYVFLGASAPPDYRGVDLAVQPWTHYGFNSSNVGTTIRYDFKNQWMLDAGIFRSAAQTQVNYEPFLFDTGSDGVGDYSIAASPRRKSYSNSGELRLTRRFDTDAIRNALYFSVKGRDRSIQSGGADNQDYGPATLTAVPQFSMPVFDLGPVTVVKAHQVTPGIAYEGEWRGIGQLSLGIQKSFYKTTADVPGAPEVSGTSEPWLYNIGAAAFLTKRLVIYASSTRGFEEIGTAPINASNRDQAVPAQLTRQVDAGLKYSFSRSLAAVAGVFKIDKPYFDLDQNNFFRQVGTTSNSGVELSLSGALTDRFTIVAGYIYIDPKVEYEAAPGVQATRTAIGPTPGLLRANFQYRPRFLDGLIFDAKVEHTSNRYARYNSLSLPAATSIDLGARYNMSIFAKPATWRLQLYNVNNTNYFTPSASGQLQSYDGRHLELSLAFDL